MNNRCKEKIVVTSIGISSPIGFSLSEFDAFVNNNNCIIKEYPIDQEDMRNILAKYEGIEYRRLDHLSLLASVAAITCIKNNNITINDKNKEEIGGVFSTVFGPVSSARDFIYSGLNNKNGITSASPLIFPYTVGNAPAGVITIFMKAIGFNTTLNSDNPIYYSTQVIKNRKAKALLCGGYEEVSSEIIESFAARTVKINGEIIDAPIKHLVEGSAMVFIESLEFAKSHNANILFEICGTGVVNNIQKREISIDNFGYITPLTVQKSMNAALSDAEISKERISLIISLARSDSMQTDSEKVAICEIWEETIPEIFYIKQKIGETLGANDVFALIGGYLKLTNDKSETAVLYALVNSYHVGGNCFSTIIKYNKHGEYI